MSLKKIAQEVGVSVSTVSRVLNHPEYKCSSLELRDRIFAAAREMHYVPNETAQRLRAGTHGISEAAPFRVDILVTGEETDPFLGEIAAALQTEIEKRQCMMTHLWHAPLLADEALPLSEIRRRLEILREDKEDADGVILVGACGQNALRQLKKMYSAVIAIDRETRGLGIDEIGGNGKAAASAAVEYLLRLGHRKIAYAGALRDEPRLAGFQETLLRHGMTPDAEDVLSCAPTEQGGYQVMEYLIQRENRPTALYCARDIIAIGMLKALGKYKRRTYEPSLVATDDIIQARYTSPTLTTVALPKEEMASLALTLLLDRLSGRHKAPVRLEQQSELILRGSCEPWDESDYCEYYI